MKRDDLITVRVFHAKQKRKPLWGRRLEVLMGVLMVTGGGTALGRAR